MADNELKALRLSSCEAAVFPGGTGTCGGLGPPQVAPKASGSSQALPGRTASKKASTSVLSATSLVVGLPAP